MHSILATETILNLPSQPVPGWAWGVFAAVVLGTLVADLLLFNRKARIQGVREAAIWSGVWIGLALAFNVGVYFWKGRDAESAIEFSTAYLVEQALSVDNLFIFLVIFRYFGVPTVYQHRILFWGVIGAQAMRGLMIFSGVELLKQFHVLIFIFGAILIYSAIKLMLSKDEGFDPEKSWAYRMARKFLPISEKFVGEKFFVKEGARRMVTPLFLVLVVVEFTDLLFAVDSIPACLAITRDAFIVYTSNIFAVMGLRAYYFLLAGFMDRLCYLKPALSLVLAFIGGKMLVEEGSKFFLPNGQAWAISDLLSLGIVAAILAVALVASLLKPAPERKVESKTEKSSGAE